MLIRTSIAGAACLLAACSSLTPDASDGADRLPNYKITDPKTGCVTFEDGKPGRKPCLIYDFPVPARVSPQK